MQKNAVKILILALCVLLLGCTNLADGTDDDKVSPTLFIPDADAIDVPNQFKYNNEQSIEIWDYKHKEPIHISFNITIDDLVILFGKQPDSQSPDASTNTVYYQFMLENDGFILFAIENETNKLALIYPQNSDRFTLPVIARLPISENELERVFGTNTGVQGTVEDEYKYVYFNDQRYPGLRFDIKKENELAYGFRIWGPAWYKYL